MNFELDEVEQNILNVVNDLCEVGVNENWETDAKWTSEIMKRIGKIGREKGYYICGTGWNLPEGQGEWLYDLTWLVINGDDIVDVPLVLESEWGLDKLNLDEDFSKLLVARAEHRIMIFQNRTSKEGEGNIDFMVNKIAAFKRSQPGDRYLLVGIIWRGEEKIIRKLIVVPN